MRGQAHHPSRLRWHKRVRRARTFRSAASRAAVSFANALSSSAVFVSSSATYGRPPGVATPRRVRLSADGALTAAAAAAARRTRFMSSSRVRAAFVPAAWTYAHAAGAEGACVTHNNAVQGGSSFHPRARSGCFHCCYCCCCCSQEPCQRSDARSPAAAQTGATCISPARGAVAAPFIQAVYL